MAYYAGVDGAYDATGRLLDLLAEHDAVGLFHLSNEVHDDETVERFRGLFDTVLELNVDGEIEHEG